MRAVRVGCARALVLTGSLWDVGHAVLGVVQWFHLVHESPSFSSNADPPCNTGYIAGFVDLDVSNRSDLYDVFVNLADSEITIAPLAKG